MVFVEIFHQWLKISWLRMFVWIFTNGQRTFGLGTRTFDLRYFARTLIIMPTIVLHSNLAYNILIINFYLMFSI
jgi:hypothetical protein